MDKSAVVGVVARFRQAIEARGIRPQKVILYGSYADGTHREGSDIDVVIVSDDFAGKGYWDWKSIRTTHEVRAVWSSAMLKNGHFTSSWAGRGRGAGPRERSD